SPAAPSNKRDPGRGPAIAADRRLSDPARPQCPKGSKATSTCDVVGCSASHFWRSIPPADRVLLNSAQHSALLRTRMSGIFHRQLAEYADYHRDQRNCLMHIIGNPILFVGAVLPRSLLSVTVFGVETSAALLLVIPALILWISWDVGLGLAIVAAAIPLLLIATIIANHVSVAAVWIITILLTVIGWALQIVGHQFFEQRRPALLDNPIHMLISPMYLFAKLFVALGFRRDLAALLQKSPA